MPWKVKTVSDVRLALCHSVRTGSMSVVAAAARFGVSRKTAHKWLVVFDADPNATSAAFANRSRRPVGSPRRTGLVVEQKVLELRDKCNWGPRKIRGVLCNQMPGVPSVKTVGAILARNGRVVQPATAPVLQRFERESPNDLWQLDYKGPVEVNRKKITPLTILDDHSRYLLSFKPCFDLTMSTAWDILWNVFGEVGLPLQILCDNAFNARANFRPAGLSWFDSRLVRLNIQPSHGRPYHPQTQGKVEALHRSAMRELINFNARKDSELHFHQDCDAYRHLYNTIRPHQAIGDVPPIRRWMPSPRPRPAVLPDVAYPDGSILRRVNHGRINFKNYRILCGQGIDGDHVRVEERDAEVAVFYCTRQIRCISNDQLKHDVVL